MDCALSISLIASMSSLFFVCLFFLSTCYADYPFRNTTIPWGARVDDLVSRLTLPDIMFQMAKGGAGPQGGPAPAIPRLGIEPFAWNTECLRGDANSGEATGFPQAIGLAAAFKLTIDEIKDQLANGGGADVPAPAIERLGIDPYQWDEECVRGAAAAGPATSFPQAIGLAAAFSPQLIFDVAEATSIEVRAKHTDYAKRKEYGDHKGLSCFSPVINMMRHPLWGRNQETYGEDPYLSGVYAENFVMGLQGDHIRYVRANAGCKHFDVHGGPENIPESRFSFDAKVSDRDWHLTFLPAFKKCVEAGSYGIMCSFNKINGVPACANQELLTEILRKAWGFSGYVISDEEAVENLVLFHHYANDSMEATIDVLKAGLNIELTTSRKDPYFFTMKLVVAMHAWLVARCICLSLNGIPTCANQELLTDILRGEWGFKGYVVSDAGALENVISGHKYLDNLTDTAAACIKAGCNLELAGGIPYVYNEIVNAIQQGKLSEDLVIERVKPLFYTRMRLGEFDPPEMNPYMEYDLSVVQSVPHRQLAIRAAVESFVMLKNDNGLLPIKKHFNKIAIIGPMADNLEQLYGTYSADPDAKYAKTPLQGLQGMADTVNYAVGCKDNKCDNYSASDVKTAVQDVQLVIICVGTGQELEAEGNDRYTMDLPSNQTQLIQDVVAAAAGSPILLLLFSGGPVNISFADRDPRIEAIMQCFFPAQATGEALFKTITLDSPEAGPAGRLPYTWYDTADQVPSMTDYSMTGRTYRYFKGSPLYPFGYGLSYTTFQYLKMTLIDTIAAGDYQYIFGVVMNTGSTDSYEVVQAYMSWLTTNETMPYLQLVGFQKLFIKSGSSQEFKFTITDEQMAVWTDNGFFVQPGKMAVYVGGQQPNQKRTTGSNILQANFQIVGQKYRGKY